MWFTRRKRKEKSQLKKGYTLERLVTCSVVGLVGFLATLFSASVMAPVQNTSAETLADRSSSRVRALVQSTNYSLTISSSGVDLELAATPDGNIVAGSDTVKVQTNNPNGYKLYIATTTAGTNGNKLWLNGNSSNVDGTNSISASDGSFDNPITLANNTWGYALTKSDAANVFDYKGITATTDFSDDYDISDISPNTTWAGVPAKGGDQLIKVTSAADQSSSSTNVDTTVYYGVKATNAVQSGTYSNTILYTAIADSAAVDTITINPSSLATNAASKTVVIATSLVTNISNIDASTVTATIGGQDCTGITLSNDATDGNVVITCTAPTLAVGSHTVQVTIPEYSKTFTLEDGFTYTAPATHGLAITFAGTGVSKVQVRTATGATGGELMGEVTVSGNSVTGLTEDTEYYLYPTFTSGYELSSWTNTGGVGTLSSTSATNPTFTVGAGDGAITITGKSSGPSTMQEMTKDYCKNSMTTGATLTLTDTRDSNAYTVAKLGDGNCWMVQNLRLGADPNNLTTAKAFSLTTANSDAESSFSIETTDISSGDVTTSWGSTSSWQSKHVYLTGDPKYGNYYNWYTATAGSTKSSGDAGSICPKSGDSNANWKLPPNTGNGSYTTMFQSSGVVASGTTSGSSQTSVTSAMQAAPYSFPLSRYYNNGPQNQDSNGLFWSRTASDANYAYTFYFNSSGNFDLQLSYNKYLGVSVRCVLVTS